MFIERPEVCVYMITIPSTKESNTIIVLETSIGNSPPRQHRKTAKIINERENLINLSQLQKDSELVIFRQVGRVFSMHASTSKRQCCHAVTARQAIYISCHHDFLTSPKGPSSCVDYLVESSQVDIPGCGIGPKADVCCVDTGEDRHEATL